MKQHSIASRPVRALAACVLPLLLCSGLSASQESLGDLMMRFHREPTRERFDAIQRLMDERNAAYEADDGLPTLKAATFLARVHEKHGWPLRVRGRLLSLAEAIVQGGPSERARYINDDSRVDTDKLQVWWAGFFATGETRYLDLVIAQLDEAAASATSEPVDPRGRLAFHAHASLVVNSTSQPIIIAHLRSLAEREPPHPLARLLGTLAFGAERAPTLVLDELEVPPCRLVGPLKVTTVDMTSRGALTGRMSILVRSGAARSRLESIDASDQSVQAVTVRVGNDSWTANLTDMTGRHRVHEAAAPGWPEALIPGKGPALDAFQYGCEWTFLTGYGLEPTPVRLGDRDLLEFAVRSGHHVIRMWFDPETRAPVSFRWYEAGEFRRNVVYASYARDVLLTDDMFDRPVGVAWTGD